MRLAGFLQRGGIVVLALGMACSLAGRTAWGVQRVYNLVQNSSTIAISGNVDGTAITSQGTNNFGQSSLVARYAGTIRTDRVSNTVNSIRFLGGSSINAQVNGNWRPTAGGGSGTAAADYGGDLVISSADVDIAGRNLIADLTTGGAAVGISNGQFSLVTTDVDIDNGNVDYRIYFDTIFGDVVLDSGTFALAGQSGNLTGNANLSTQSIGGGMLRETLTIPVSSSLPTVTVSGYDINLTLTGQLVATADFADSGDRYWITPTTNTFSTASNWNPSLTPGTAETAIFDLGTNHTVNFSGNATNNRLRVENDRVAFALGTRTYNVTNSSTTTPSVVVGASSGDVGRMTLSGTGAGGTLSSVHAYLGSVASSTGQMTVGAGATWNNSGQLSVGRGGSGTLSINGGGKVVAPASGVSFLGYAAGSNGSASISGVGSTWTNGQLYAGFDGTGSITVSSGGGVSSTIARIGYRATGSAIVSGGSTFTSTSTLYVGDQAQGALTVQSGSMLSTATTNIGASAGSNGTVTVTGTNSTWNNSGSVYVGGTSSVAGNQGTLNVGGNASVVVGSTLRTWAGGTINLSSGKLKTTSLNLSQGTFIQTSGQLVATTVTGNFNRAGGTLTPGDAAMAGLTTVTGSYTQQAGATLAIELGGESVGSQFDRLSVTGPATIAGTLNVSLINSFMPDVGDDFLVLLATSGLTGTFATHNLPALSGSDLEWLINYSATSLTLSVGLKGDFNGDGVVNAADYVHWRNNSGSQAEYDLWVANFGNTGSGSGSSASLSSVPEPAAWVLLAMATIPLWIRRLRPHR